MGNGESLVTMHVKKGDTFVFPQGSAHWGVNYSPTEQLATVGGFTAPCPDAAPLADFLDESKKVNNLLPDAVLGENYRSALALQAKPFNLWRQHAMPKVHVKRHRHLHCH